MAYCRAGTEACCLHLFFPSLNDVVVKQITDRGDHVLITARTCGAQAACRGCGMVSARVHGRYRRRLHDLTAGGRAVVIELEVCRFVCGNPACALQTFAEQAPALAPRLQRRTPVLRRLLDLVALALGGRPGSRLAAALGMIATASPTTLIRLLRALPDPEIGQVVVLGVDDFAKRRGHSYATVLVDLDDQRRGHRVIDVLQDREADTLADWLREHPGVQVICRDRAGAYAQGANDGAPEAIQVADRWHLWDNLGGYVEKTIAAHHRCLTNTAPPSTAAAPDPAHTDPQQAAAQLAQQRADNNRFVVRTRQRYEHVQALKAQGKGIKTIKRELGLAKETVRKFYRAQSVDDLIATSLAGRPSKLDEFKPHLHERWNSGCTNVTQLHREINALGYHGSYNTVCDYLAPFRKLKAAPPAVPAPPKVRHITSWIRRRPDNLDPDEQLKLNNVLAACPHLNALAGHVTSFAEMMTGRHGDRLDAWIAAVRADDLPALHTFANGLEQDYDAVRAGLTLPHSSGPVEGNVTRIKALKRQMYGRANFDLLRIRILHPA
ncbi:ISL3 family transposase [Actinomadura sp. 6N118]|uniref:ISL3 family transposase n=1 Tax=Actinomadura sp. 6N118 TaxID=3375151 RepID=UPI0037A1FC3C